MSQCNLDHNLNDVAAKLASQESFLPSTIYIQLQHTLSQTLSQETLNTIFHLLKKYDLSSTDEQRRRDMLLLALCPKKN